MCSFSHLSSCQLMTNTDSLGTRLIYLASHFEVNAQHHVISLTHVFLWFQELRHSSATITVMPNISPNVS